MSRFAFPCLALLSRASCDNYEGQVVDVGFGGYKMHAVVPIGVELGQQFLVQMHVHGLWQAIMQNSYGLCTD